MTVHSGTKNCKLGTITSLEVIEFPDGDFADGLRGIGQPEKGPVRGSGTGSGSPVGRWKY